MNQIDTRATAPDSLDTARFEALDACRGLAALLVAVYHLRIASHALFAETVGTFFLAVDFFFVLSGFVLFHAYANRLNSSLDLTRFLIRRIGRLWPLHLFSMAIMIAIMFAEHGAVHILGMNAELDPITPGTFFAALAQQVTLTHGYNPVLDFGWNYPSWSISAEFQSYLLFASVILIFGRRILFPSILIIGVCLYLLYLYSDEYISVTFGLGMVRGFAGFFLGALLRAYYRPIRDWIMARNAAGLFQLFALGLLVVFLANFEKSPLSLLGPFVFAICIAALAVETGWACRFLNWRVFAGLGAWSYSIYMLHVPIYTVITKAAGVVREVFGIDITRKEAIGGNRFEGNEHFFLDFGSVWTNDIAAALAVGLVVLVSAFTYHFLEKPSRDWFNAKAKGLNDNRMALAGERPRK